MQSKPVLKMFTRQLTMKRTKKVFNHCKKKLPQRQIKVVLYSCSFTKKNSSSVIFQKFCPQIQLSKL